MAEAALAIARSHAQRERDPGYDLQPGWLIGAVGGLVLFLYGVVPTLQPANFGRVYAAYGGVFVVLSILWGWWVDRVRPDAADVTGALLCIAGVGVIMYWPRG